MALLLLSRKTSGEKYISLFFKKIFPADLTLIIVWIVACMAAIYLPILNETPVRVILTIPLVLFIPGYCLIAALFPKDEDIYLIERVALSFGLSFAVVPFIGLGLNFTGIGIRLDPIVISLTFFSIAMIFAAYYKRSLLPFEKRFSVPFWMIGVKIRKAVLPSNQSRINRLLSIVQILMIIFLIITLFYVVITPKEGKEHFTDFYILGETQMASDYPNLITTGQNYPVFIGVGNHENQDTSYTIETWKSNTEFDNVTNTSKIITMDPIDHLSFILPKNETRIFPYNISVDKTGYNRIDFLLFTGSPPGFEITGNDRKNMSYRQLHLWVTVEETTKNIQAEEKIKSIIYTS